MTGEFIEGMYRGRKAAISASGPFAYNGKYEVVLHLGLNDREPWGDHKTLFLTPAQWAQMRAAALRQSNNLLKVSEQDA